jgi:hypothetical protein
VCNTCDRLLLNRCISTGVAQGDPDPDDLAREVAVEALVRQLRREGHCKPTPVTARVDKLLLQVRLTSRPLLEILCQDRDAGLVLGETFVVADRDQVPAPHDALDSTRRSV